MFKTESYTKGAILSIIFNIAAKAIQLFSVFIIVSLVGANRDTDLYYFLFNFATFVIGGFISSLNIAILMPEFIRLRELGDLKNAMGFINKYLYLYLFIGLVGFFIVGFFAVGFFRLITNFETIILQQNKIEILLSIFLIILIIISNLLTNVLTTYKYFTIPSIVTFFNNLIALIFLLFFYKKYGIVSAMVGVTFGYLINTVLLMVFLRKKIKWNFISINFTFDKRILKYIGASQLTEFVVAIRTYFTQFLISGFVGGVPTSINWGTQVSMLGEVFINTQVYSISSIKFSELNAANNKTKAISLLYDLFSIIISINCLLFVILFSCSEFLGDIINFKGKFSLDVLNVLRTCILFFSIIPLINIFTFLSNKILSSFQFINFTTTRIVITGQILQLIVLFISVKYFGIKGYFIGSLIGFIVIAIFSIIPVLNNFESFSILRIFKNNKQTFLITIVLALSIKSVLHFNNFLFQFSPIIKVTIISILVTLCFIRKIQSDFNRLKVLINNAET